MAPRVHPVSLLVLIVGLVFGIVGLTLAIVFGVKNSGSGTCPKCPDVQTATCEAKLFTIRTGVTDIPWDDDLNNSNSSTFKDAQKKVSDSLTQALNSPSSSSAIVLFSNAAASSQQFIYVVSVTRFGQAPDGTVVAFASGAATGSDPTKFPSNLDTDVEGKLTSSASTTNVTEPSVNDDAMHFCTSPDPNIGNVTPNPNEGLTTSIPCDVTTCATLVPECPSTQAPTVCPTTTCPEVHGSTCAPCTCPSTPSTTTTCPIPEPCPNSTVTPTTCPTAPPSTTGPTCPSPEPCPTTCPTLSPPTCPTCPTLDATTCAPFTPSCSSTASPTTCPTPEPCSTTCPDCPTPTCPTASSSTCPPPPVCPTPLTSGETCPPPPTCPAPTTCPAPPECPTTLASGATCPPAPTCPAPTTCPTCPECASTPFWTQTPGFTTMSATPGTAGVTTSLPGSTTSTQTVTTLGVVTGSTATPQTVTTQGITTGTPTLPPTGSTQQTTTSVAGTTTSSQTSTSSSQTTGTEGTTMGITGTTQSASSTQGYSTTESYSTVMTTAEVESTTTTQPPCYGKQYFYGNLAVVFEHTMEPTQTAQDAQNVMINTFITLQLIKYDGYLIDGDTTRTLPVAYPDPKHYGSLTQSFQNGIRTTEAFNSTLTVVDLIGADSPNATIDDGLQFVLGSQAQDRPGAVIIVGISADFVDSAKASAAALKQKGYSVFTVALNGTGDLSPLASDPSYSYDLKNPKSFDKAEAIATSIGNYILALSPKCIGGTPPTTPPPTTSPRITSSTSPAPTTPYCPMKFLSNDIAFVFENSLDAQNSVATSNLTATYLSSSLIPRAMSDLLGSQTWSTVSQFALVDYPDPSYYPTIWGCCDFGKVTQATYASQLQAMIIAENAFQKKSTPNSLNDGLNYANQKFTNLNDGRKLSIVLFANSADGVAAATTTAKSLQDAGNAVVTVAVGGMFDLSPLSTDMFVHELTSTTNKDALTSEILNVLQKQGTVCCDATNCF